MDKKTTSTKKNTEEIFDQTFYTQITDKIAKMVANHSEISEAEVLAIGKKMTEISFEQGFIKYARQKAIAGLGLRVLNSEGKQALTYTLDFSTAALEKIVDRGIKMMNASTPNPFLKDFVHPAKNYRKIPGLYDPKINTLTLDEINDALAPIFQLKQKELPPISISGRFEPVVEASLLWNTNGIELWEQGTAASVSVNVGLAQNGQIGNGFDFQATTNWKELNVKSVATEGYSMAQKGLRKGTISTGEYPILLSPKAVSGLILHTIGDSIDADQVQNNASFLGDKLDTQIASPLLSIRDEPHLEGKLGSCGYDSEGTETNPLDVVKKGVLSTFFYNLMTANKAKRVSNGHAARGGFSSPVGISSHNMIIEPGNQSWEDILHGIKKGVYFENTGDDPNMVTGDFSGLIMIGYVIENGQIGPALQETMLGMNLLDAFQGIEQISKEQIWLQDMRVPWIKLRSGSISSRT